MRHGRRLDKGESLAHERKLNETLVRTLLERHFPQHPFGDAPVEYLAEGQDFMVFAVAGWAFRFPKRAETADWLVKEQKLLDYLEPRVSLAVPSFTHRGEPSDLFPFPFVGYRLLPGVAGDIKENIDWRQTAIRLGRFLSELHSVPVVDLQSLEIPVCSDLFAPDAYLGRVRDTLHPELTGLPVVLCRACESFLQASSVPDPPQNLRLIHGDLEAEHLLFAPETKELQGVLDWADACVGDPARDFGAFWAWGGERFLFDLLANYTCPLDRNFLDRCLFLGRCFALLDYHESLPDGEEQIKFSIAQLENVFTKERTVYGHIDLYA
jgi:aminoglycoside phosphotransferase (APT) family kinase protein